MSAPAHDRKKPRILIADDEPDLLSVMKDTLEHEGFEVDTASDGREALDQIRKEAPDLAIIDLMMPKVDGFAVCRELRQDPFLEHLPLIILSASTEQANKVQGLNLGADDFITKPVDIGELLARVRMIMRRNVMNLDANPLTHLPGNVSLERHIEEALKAKKHIAVLYLDLNQFKAYNDHYGYEHGDHVIKATAQLLVRVARDEAPSPGNFIGHIGGDDFIIITTPERMEDLCRRIIAAFDARAPSFYKEEDRRRGHIVSTDRQGRIAEFPLLSIAIGVCHNLQRPLKTYAQIAEHGAELKKHAKEKKGSAYVIDRRR